MAEEIEIRQTHTIRIFGINRNGERLDDVWLDIERVDVFMTNEQIDGHWQGVFRRLHWLDDPEDPVSGGTGNTARVRGAKKICSPDEKDQEDPDEWVPVYNNIEIQWNESVSDSGRVQQSHASRTDIENTARTVFARRVFHRDTIIDDDAQKALDADPNIKAYVVASSKYDFSNHDPDDKKNRDDDNFVEVQYASQTYLNMNEDSKNDEDHKRTSGKGKDQNVEFNLKNDYVLNFTDEAKGPANPVHGFDPPWALDPFQNIVNCNFGGLAVEFGDKDKDAPGDKSGALTL